MSHLSEEDGENLHSANETAKFNDVAHLQYMEDIFSFFVQVFRDCCICLIGDNAKINLKETSLCQKQCVGCNSHKYIWKLPTWLRHKHS